MNGSHSGLTDDQAEQLRRDLQERADFENAKITFSKSGAGQEVTLTWTVVLASATPQAAHKFQGGAPATGVSAAEQAFRLFTQSGWTPAQAAGLLGNIEAESNFNPFAVGDKGAAFGICQWHSDRQVQFRDHFGHLIQKSTFEEQLKFVNFELREGNETKAGGLLEASTTAAEAGRVISTFYERPADTAGNEANRAALAEKWFKHFSG